MLHRSITALYLIACFTATAQTTGRENYMSSGSEFNFSAPVLDVNGNDAGAVVRFAPWVNAQQTLNIDQSEHFGLFIGLSIGNNGFIWDDPNSNFRYKFRTYNLGLPVGIKLGNMNGNLLFAGYSPEWAFNYKEKVFANEEKIDKLVVWFSDRNETLCHAVFLGFQSHYGTTIKFKYYVTNFHNTDFTVTNNGVESKPYEGFNANVVSVSLGFALFKKYEVYGAGSRPTNTTASVRR